MNWQTVIDQVADYQTFMTVDELDASARALAQKYPDVVTLFEAGKSRKGHPILCLKIGDGPKNALCFAFPHPNEPIGAMTMEYFAQVLAENQHLRNRLGFTWYIIKCADPDGVRLNENWFKGPFTLTNYIRHFYRPALYEQVEWTFPIAYKNLRFNRPLPETRALMNIVDRIKPQFVYSLHNAAFGGAFWYLSHDAPELIDAFHTAAKRQNMPIHLSEPEAPFIQPLAPGVFRFFGIQEHYDYLEQLTGQPPQLGYGTCCGDYAASKGECLNVVTELPYFSHPDIQNTDASNLTLRDVFLQSAELSDKHYGEMARDLEKLHSHMSLRPHISEDNPFVRYVEEMVNMWMESKEATRKWAEKNPELQRPATISQVFNHLRVKEVYMGLIHGLIVRAYHHELERLKQSGETSSKTFTFLLHAYEEKKARLTDMCNRLETELSYSVVPIQNLVRIQLESGIAAALYSGDRL